MPNAVSERRAAAGGPSNGEIYYPINWARWLMWEGTKHFSSNYFNALIMFRFFYACNKLLEQPFVINIALCFVLCLCCWSLHTIFIPVFPSCFSIEMKICWEPKHYTYSLFSKQCRSHVFYVNCFLCFGYVSCVCVFGNFFYFEQSDITPHYINGMYITYICGFWINWENLVTIYEHF